jgi:hypothetical protein
VTVAKKQVPSTEPWRLAGDLVETALIDTVYGDLYLQRARHFLAPALTEAQFAGLQHMKTEVLNLPSHILVAMKQTNWVEVKELSNRMASLKRILAEEEGLLRVAGRTTSREPLLWTRSLRGSRSWRRARIPRCC